MNTVISKTVYQTEEYNTTVMEHVVENVMSLSRFDGIKSKNQDHDNRLNRLEQHCKLSRISKAKDGKQ